jgi:hypothetical protein
MLKIFCVPAGLVLYMKLELVPIHRCHLLQSPVPTPREFHSARFPDFYCSARTLLPGFTARCVVPLVLSKLLDPGLKSGGLELNSTLSALEDNAHRILAMVSGSSSQ